VTGLSLWRELSPFNQALATTFSKVFNFAFTLLFPQNSTFGTKCLKYLN
jgi:hypothetical protein